MEALLKYTRLIVVLLIVFIHSNLSAQLIRTSPDNPGIDDQIEMVFDASEGNQGLKDHAGTVYFHAGLITSKSIDHRDWKQVKGKWGEADERFSMKSLGNNLYSLTFTPRSFFQVSAETTVDQLVFVFRNADGTKVGKTIDGEDILVPLKGYTRVIPPASRYLSSERHVVSHRVEDNMLIVETNEGDLTFRPFESGIVETAWHPKGFVRHDSSHAVIMTPLPMKVFVDETPDKLVFDLGELQVVMTKNPIQISYLKNGLPVLQEEMGFYIRNDARGVRFKLSDGEKIYGTGERTNKMNLRGDVYELYNRPHYGYELGAKNLNYSLPVMMSSNQYLMLIDNPQKAYLDFDSKNDGVFEFGAIGGPFRYYLIVAKDYPGLLQKYGRLTGFQPMPPLWALGNLQSRMAYRSQQETVEIVNRMIDEDFPIDAVIIDFYWFGDSILGHVGRLDWFWKNWPDPKAMIADFRTKGVKTILITEPYIIDTLANFRIASDLGILAKDSLGNTHVNREFYFGDAGLIDMFNPAAGDWFWEKYVTQIDNGVAGWWGDLGEPESHPSDIVHVAGKADEVHNIFAHYWHKMLFNKYREHYPETRLFNLNRSGFAGSQRYSIFPWTGDVSRSWGGLQAQLPAMLHMSMSGLSYIHADAGGFALGIKDEELYTRWLQFAAFSPILRPHGSGIPSEPIFFNDTTKRIVRKFMKLRYELLPYLYTMSWENSVSGLPLVKPLFFYHPDDPRLGDYDQAYYFGKDLLVAPVIIKGQQLMELPLPRGRWYDIWSGIAVRGGASLKIKINPETIPIFARAGSIIPRVEAVNTTDAFSSRRLWLHAYLHEVEGVVQGKMYEDDGQTVHAYSKGSYELLTFNGIQNREGLTFNFMKLGNGYPGMPESRLIEMITYGLNYKPVKVVVGNKGLNLEMIDPALRNAQGYWQDQNGLWHFRFHWDGSPEKLIIH
ncbi:MAG: glycoside hydrolase family 31 protein [Bacteroidales bacterium]|nr:glycoside hydrolase family 31 protein [Bacteroidales bacterium]